MLTLSISLIISIITLITKLLTTKNPNQKILTFYLISTNSIILILINTITDFEKFLDITIALFLLQIAAITFLINQKKT